MKIKEWFNTKSKRLGNLNDLITDLIGNKYKTYSLDIILTRGERIKRRFTVNHKINFSDENSLDLYVYSSRIPHLIKGKFTLSQSNKESIELIFDNLIAINLVCIVIVK